MNRVVIVGASLAGLSSARALRQQGFDGTIIIVGDEAYRPYDRPPLSKELLTRRISEVDLSLEADGEALDAQWQLGVAAARLDAPGRAVELADGSRIDCDGVILASGARARTLPGQPELTGVHVLRGLDDALDLREELVPGARLVVIGAGFIGAEVASSAVTLGLDVTVVEATRSPLAGALGAQMADILVGLHGAHGVSLLPGLGVTGFRAISDGPYQRVSGVSLTDGRLLPADVVVVGIGAIPNVEWLAGSGVHVGDGVLAPAGVLCYADGGTSVPNVVAVGDCSTWRDARSETGNYRRIEHWTTARERPATAVARLLAGSPVAQERPERAAYFWSDQYGKKIQFAGEVLPGDSVEVESGDLSEWSFLAVYRRAGAPVGVLGVQSLRDFTRWRRQLA